jgi:hypothetical protein
VLEPAYAFGVSNRAGASLNRQQGAFSRSFQVASPRVAQVLFSEAPSKGEPEEEKLSLDKVAELIDTTFVNACMQLSQGYVDVLKLLIVSIKSGYELGATPSELVAKVEAVEVKAAGRPLMPEEVRLRDAWIQIVYLVLAQADHTTENESVKESVESDIVATYAAKIPTMQQRQESGEDFRVDDLLDSDALADNPAENAIMTHSLRVMWLTLVVLEEEERCNTEFARQDAPMKPQIPGAY